MHRIIYSLIVLSISILPLSIFSEEESSRGGIEEITVTAEKRTSTVSDTSMSISAFDSSLIEDLGLQGLMILWINYLQQLEINMM